ncbi:MAG: hypothetical protein A3D10_06735 [Omnitrophica WOR_2 bacterium RIFCSPHIGHO2_02_FULL_48_11]|nr:MAG: hypothetical protein A3D10_06735 [Omnitrophica WOR_2 bacterium RIFCSPHIGHO2_02_FULL_48_11]
MTGPQLILKQLEDAIQQTPPPPAEPVPPPPLEPSPAAESPAPPEPSAPVEPVSKISIHVNAAPAAAPVDSSKIKMTEAMLKLDAVVKELKEKNK